MLSFAKKSLLLLLVLLFLGLHQVCSHSRGPTNTPLSGTFTFTGVDGRTQCKLCQIDCLSGGLFNRCNFRYYNFACLYHMDCPSVATASQGNIRLAAMLCSVYGGCTGHSIQSVNDLNRRVYELYIRNFHTHGDPNKLHTGQLTLKERAIDILNPTPMGSIVLDLAFQIQDARRSGQISRSDFIQRFKSAWNAAPMWTRIAASFNSINIEHMWDSLHSYRFDRILNAMEIWRYQVERNEKTAASIANTIKVHLRGRENDAARAQDLDRKLITRLSQLNLINRSVRLTHVSPNEPFSRYATDPAFNFRPRLYSLLSQWWFHHSKRFVWGPPDNNNDLLETVEAQGVSLNSIRQYFDAHYQPSSVSNPRQWVKQQASERMAFVRRMEQFHQYVHNPNHYSPSSQRFTFPSDWNRHTQDTWEGDALRFFREFHGLDLSRFLMPKF